MLVARNADRRVLALYANRSDEHNCPTCGSAVILKKGAKRIAHFAHRPGADCDWARGESWAHLEAKLAFHVALEARAVSSDVEVPIQTSFGNRRADVLVTAKGGHRIAIEVQHTPISPREAKLRTRSYASAEIGVVWVPILHGKTLDEIKNIDPARVSVTHVERIVLNTFERWADSFPGRSNWAWDPVNKALWKVRVSAHRLWKEETSWHDTEGNEQTGGGYGYESKRWSDLSLWGPFALSDIQFTPYIAQSQDERRSGFARCGSLKFSPRAELGLLAPF